MAQLLASAARAGVNTANAVCSDPLYAKVLLVKSTDTTSQ